MKNIDVIFLISDNHRSLFVIFFPPARSPIFSFYSEFSFVIETDGHNSGNVLHNRAYCAIRIVSYGINPAEQNFAEDGILQKFLTNIVD